MKTKHKVYRVHITCKAGHTTYQDYKSRSAAIRRLNKGDIDGWIAIRIVSITITYRH